MTDGDLFHLNADIEFWSCARLTKPWNSINVFSVIKLNSPWAISLNMSSNVFFSETDSLFQSMKLKSSNDYWLTKKIKKNAVANKLLEVLS